ncbi:restriction endonuclease [Rummeliibacillus sp. NPDC094406]|uniref:restriction endonuclease n=1 Tax=Rummeliibacillus sp. NPDC094406 TaxID=3364511 RepID=UPI0038117405
MAIWLFRAGASGEYEQKFLSDNRIYLTWDSLNIDLISFKEKEDLYPYLIEKYKLPKKRTAYNWASQLYPMANSMQIGDWIVLPSKINKTFHFGEIKSEYRFDVNANNPFYHYRDVHWFSMNVPKEVFKYDILNSFGAFMTICQIKANDAEGRLIKMYQNNWLSE